MKMIFAMLLTTLFYSATTPDASGAANGFSQTSLTSLKILVADESAPATGIPSAGCVTPEGVPSELVDRVTSHGGSITTLTGNLASVFQDNLEDTIGAKNPNRWSDIMIVKDHPGEETTMVVFFKDHCVVMPIEFPAKVIETAQGKGKI